VILTSREVGHRVEGGAGRVKISCIGENCLKRRALLQNKPVCCARHRSSGEIPARGLTSPGGADTYAALSRQAVSF
jgi:hypothetical protein